MPVGGRPVRDAARGAPGDGQKVNQRLMICLRVVANRQLSSVRRDSVVVVQSIGETGIDGRGLVAARSEALDVALTIEQEIAAVASPIGSLESSFGDVDNAPVGGRGGNSNGLERAIENRLCQQWRRLGQFDV